MFKFKSNKKLLKKKIEIPKKPKKNYRQIEKALSEKNRQKILLQKFFFFVFF